MFLRQLVIFGTLVSTTGLTMFAVGCNGSPPPAETAQAEPAPDSTAIDQRSFDLGVIEAFAEVVGYGVKKLALSAPRDPDQMARLLPDAERITEENGVLLYLEQDFLTTDLFPESITEGKEVLLIYLDPVKDEYMALKAEKAQLVADGRYEGEARTEIARNMGRLLSYDDERIEQMLADRRQ